jgi:hypothetical protein
VSYSYCCCSNGWGCRQVGSEWLKKVDGPGVRADGIIYHWLHCPDVAVRRRAAVEEGPRRRTERISRLRLDRGRAVAASALGRCRRNRKARVHTATALAESLEARKARHYTLEGRDNEIGIQNRSCSETEQNTWPAAVAVLG